MFGVNAGEAFQSKADRIRVLNCVQTKKLLILGVNTGEAFVVYAVEGGEKKGNL